MATVYSSSSQTTASLKNNMAAVTAIREQLPIEKLYLQLDKPYYTLGDTIRLKGYLLNADFLTPSARSGMLYIELDDQTGKLAKKIMLPLVSGLAAGDIALDKKEVPQGSYTVRAYTNWMRNFGHDYIFKKEIYISQNTGDATLVNANFNQQGNKVESILKFTDLNGRLLLMKDMELKVMDGKKNLSKNQLNTALDGILKVNFELPATNNKLSIVTKDVTKGVANAGEITIPVNVYRPENTDIQFMPEGGNLVAGIKTKVGFKAINEDGKGANISGKIINSKQREIATFKTSHAGMGNLDFTPQAGETYMAKVDGIKKTYPLPAVNPTGTSLSIQPTGIDSLIVILSASPGININGEYYLIAQSRGVVCYGQTISFTKSQVIKLSVAKSVFPTGIARFTLINAAHQPINERQVFINRNDNLNIVLSPNKRTYGIRDSIALAVEVKDKDGKPVQGSFSLAVTDDGQVKVDSLGGNILNNMLLTSDLKGTIEQPEYYFINPNPAKEAELDNLLLTQGWVGYDWKDVFAPKTKLVTYQPETEFVVKGLVTNAFGKPLAKSGVSLVANNPLMFRDTITNKEGRFVFKNLFPIDTAVFEIQAKNKNGKEINVILKVDEVKPPEFTNPKATQVITPWYLNTDSIRLSNFNIKSAETKAIADYKGEGTMLGEVTVAEKKIVRGSRNLNGPGEADLIFDETEMKKAGNTTLEALLQEKILGFNIGAFTPPRREYPESLGLANILRRDFPFLRDDAAAMAFWDSTLRRKMHKPWRLGYKIKNQEVRFIIDGIDLDFYYDDMNEVVTNSIRGVIVIPADNKRYQYIKGIIDYFTAKDIIGIEYMSSGKYTAAYNVDFERYRERTVPGRSNEFAYIEITTRAGKGPFMQAVPGTYLQRTLGFTLPKQFYGPKYNIKNSNLAMGTDMRSTLHWEPNVITDKDGKATISFFSADKISPYTVIIEGTDMNGNLGYKKQVIGLAK